MDLQVLDHIPRCLFGFGDPCYDQIPTISFHTDNTSSIGMTVAFCHKRLSDDKLPGFLQTIWKLTMEDPERHTDMGYEERILTGIDLRVSQTKSITDFI